MTVYRNIRDITGKNRQGFTLIEVLIAVFLISIGILALIRLQVASVKGNSDSMGITEGVMAVNDEIETIIADSIGNFSNGDEVTLTRGRNNQYTIIYKVQSIPVAETSSVYKQIVVTTTWDVGGKTKTITNNIVKLDKE